MKRRTFALGAAAVFAAAGAAMGTPLRMDYCVQALGGGQYRYQFTLTLDNNDNSWVSGQGFGWIIFGDRSQGSTQLLNFVGDNSSLPAGPFTQFQTSGGGHNGPTLGPVVQGPPNYPPNLWIPTAVGQSLTWAGAASSDLDAGQLLWSNLMAGSGAVYANFISANRIASCSAGPTGACCRPEGTCVQWESTSCGNIGGVYRGNGSLCPPACPQPATGACCLDSGCTILTQAACISYSGTYRGNGTACGASANCAPATAHREIIDAGDTPATAKGVNGGTGPLSTIYGTLSDFVDVDMYRIRMCDPANFNAAMTGVTFGGIFLFDASGVGVTSRIGFNGPATLTNLFTSSLMPGEYYLAVAGFGHFPVDASGQYLWINNHYDNVERRPDGPGAANPIDHWDNGGGTDGAYTVALSGACFLGGGPATCYANCDGSTGLPLLTVNDYVCFQSRFAAGDSYANCDHSTGAPILTINDFVCFQSQFAAGCSAP